MVDRSQQGQEESQFKDDSNHSRFADLNIERIHDNVLDAERSRDRFLKISFVITWFFAATLITTVLYVACQGVMLVNSEMRFANQYIKANQVCCSKNVPVVPSESKSEKGKDKSTPNYQVISDEAAVITSFSSAYAKSLIFLGVVLSILTTAFVTLTLSASKMFLPKPAEKIDAPADASSTNYPPVDWVIKIIEAISGKKETKP